MKKKVLGLVLTTAMLVGASMTAFAADPITSLPDKETEIEMAATVATATISVTVENEGTIVANPYGLVDSTLDLDGKDTLKGATITITNGSDVAIEVGLKGTIKLSDGNATKDKAAQVSIASDAKSIESATTKQVYVQAEVVNKAGNDGKPAADAVYLADTKGKAVAPLVYQAKAAAIETNPVLAKAGYNKNAEGAVSSAQTEIVVVITGATSTSATSAWNDSDAFKVITTYDLKMAKTPSAFVAKS